MSVVSFTINGKYVTCKNNDTIGDIFDEYVKDGRF